VPPAKVHGDRLDFARWHTTREVVATHLWRRGRFKRRLGVGELCGEGREFCDAAGDLRLLVLDQAADARVCRDAVDASPDREELCNLVTGEAEAP
jgi:hypothetical protein